jgi:putative component of membrane protein insertase Oxa1/YidC/SpoIIIJ protein YidD
MTRHQLFIGGVPATGKSRLGQWLAENHGYVHIDAEIDKGVDFDKAGVHSEWDDLISTGRATKFVKAIGRLRSPVVINWGFPTCFLYVVNALQAEGVHTWWLNAQRNLARQAFVARGRFDPSCFDRQMADIEREWLLISSVFGPRIVEGLRSDGSQRKPEDIWCEICAAG